jgi:hypothetical protein
MTNNIVVSKQQDDPVVPQTEPSTIPLKDVVTWVREGVKSPHSHFEVTQRNMYKSLNMALGDDEDPVNHDGGYQVESKDEDIATPEKQEPYKIMPHLESISSTEDDEAETGYEGDDDVDDSETTRSLNTIDSLDLAAERLPHLLHHPQHFETLKKPRQSSRRVPRRGGPRVSRVLRRNAALKRRSILKHQEELMPSETTYEHDEAKDPVPSLRSSVNRLRSQDSIPLARERLEHQHQFSSDDDDSFLSDEEDELPQTFRPSIHLLRSQDSILLAKERMERQHQNSSDDDDSFFHEKIIAPIHKNPVVGFQLDAIYMHSPRAITNTKSHDAFLALKKSPQNNQNETTVDSPISFPSLNVA